MNVIEEKTIKKIIKCLLGIQNFKILNSEFQIFQEM